MINEFSRLLSLLRTERGISQREAAAALNISQALLSHYENGVREPGFEFLVKVSEYYGVSCDYLLGRTMCRNVNVLTEKDIEEDIKKESNQDTAKEPNADLALQKKVVINSVALLTDMAEAIGNREFATAVIDYLSASIYKVYRYIYSANSENTHQFFAVRPEFFRDACERQMNKCEEEIKSYIYGFNETGSKLEKIDAPRLSHDDVMNQYPKYAQSFFMLLHTVSDKMKDKNTEE